MKTYYNGPRKGMMYGGGATMRKPMMYGGMAKKGKKMQMGGMAEKNIKPNQSGMMQATMPNNMMNTMGMMYGGQAKLDKNKDGKISGKDFKIMK
jgi:hypothetical protein